MSSLAGSGAGIISLGGDSSPSGVGGGGNNGPGVSLSGGTVTVGGSTTTTSGGNDQRSSSVAELRRKAQEHSAALLQSLHHVASFQHLQLPVGLGLNLPPLTTLQALAARKCDPPQTSGTVTSATQSCNASSPGSSSVAQPSPAPPQL